MSEQTNPDDARRQRLDEVIGAFLVALDSGEKPDPQDWLARHANLSPELDEFFADRERMDDLLEPLKARPVEQAGDATDSMTTAPEGSAGSSPRTTPEDPDLALDRSDAPADGGVPVPLRGGTRVRYFGDYELQRVLGEGGMGTVYKARQISLNRPVALKIIKATRLGSDDDLRQFHNEAEAVARLDHPNIVPIFEVGRFDDQQYFSMKLIAGESLDKRLEDYTAHPRRAAQLLAGAAEAIHHSHQRGILHRDLKPANVLVDVKGQPHITDFGLAKRVEGDSELTQSGAILGTPAYMAPEQTSGKRGTVTTSTDVYGLGAILYALLTGRAPFGGTTVLDTLEQVRERPPEPPRKLNPRIPRDLEVICLKCLEKEPRRRYASADALAEELKRYLAGKPITARPAGRLERALMWCRRNPVLAGLTGAVLALLVALAIGSTIAAIRIGWARDDARLAQRYEAEERQRSERHADDAKKRLARQYVSNAVRALDAGDHYTALPWLVEALRQDEDKPEREKMQRLRIGMVLQGCPKLTQLWFPPGDVIDLSFVGDQLRAVIADGNSVQVWDALAEQPLCVPLTHDWPVWSAGFRGDGKRVVLAGGKGDAKNFGLVVWDLVSGRQVCMLDSTDKDCLASKGTFTADGKRILVQRHWQANPYNFGGEVGIWDAETGKLLTPLHPFTGSSEPGWLRSALGGGALLSKDGNRVVSMSSSSISSSAVWVWDAHTGKNISPVDSPLGKGQTTSGNRMVALNADFSPDVTKLAVGYGSDEPFLAGEVCVWDIATGMPATPRLKTPAGVVHVAFSPNGKFLHLMAADSTRWVWDMKETECERHILVSAERGQPASPPWLSPNGIHTAVSGEHVPGRDHVFVWNMATNSAATPMLRHEGPVQYLAFHSEGFRLATAGPGLPVRVFDFGGALPTFPGREFTTLPRDVKGQSSSEFSPDGKRAILRVWPEASQLWDLEAEKPLGPAHYIEGLSHSGDLSAERPILIKTLDRGNDQTEFRLGNVVTGKTTRILVANETGKPKPWSFAAPDGRWLITGGGKPGTQIWDADSGSIVTTLESNATDFDCSPDSGTLVGFDADGQSHAWEIPGGQLLWSAPVARRDRYALEFSQDSQSLLIISKAGDLGSVKGLTRGRVENLDARTGKGLFEPILLPKPVREHCLSRDGKKLFTLDLDNACRLWDARTGEPLGPEWKTEMSSAAAFSDDGARVFLEDSDKMRARLWDPLRGKPQGPPVQALNSWWLSPDARMEFAKLHPMQFDGSFPFNEQGGSHLVEAETGLPLTPRLSESPNEFLFSADGKRLLFIMNYVVHRRELITEERSSGDLENLAVVLSQHRVDESESLVLVDRPTLQKAWQEHKSRHLLTDTAYAAREQYEWHVQAALDCLNAQFWDGAIHQDGQAWGGALLHLDFALRQNPNSGLLHYLRSLVWENLGEDDRALADLDRAVTLEPRCRNLWESRGWLHLRLEKLPQATADFVRVIDIGTDEFRVWHHLALLYLSAGNIQPYHELCNRILAGLKPEGDLNPEELLLTCVLQPGAVDPSRLQAIIANLNRIELGPIPKSPALAYLRAGKHAEAVAYLERYFKQQDEVGEAHAGADLAWAALIYHKVGRQAEAETWHRRAADWRDKQRKTAEWAERAEFDLIFKEFEATRVSAK